MPDKIAGAMNVFDEFQLAEESECDSDSCRSISQEQNTQKLLDDLLGHHEEDGFVTFPAVDPSLLPRG